MKKVWLGFVAVFIVSIILDWVINGVLLGGLWKESESLFRADMNDKMWIYWVITLIGSFFFSFIFSRGYEGKGWMEGVRYGLYIGIWMSVGMAYGTYAMVAIPYSLALSWFLCGVVEYIILGIVLAWIFGMKPKTAAPAA